MVRRTLNSNYQLTNLSPYGVMVLCSVMQAGLLRLVSLVDVSSTLNDTDRTAFVLSPFDFSCKLSGTGGTLVSVSLQCHLTLYSDSDSDSLSTKFYKESVSKAVSIQT